eukprot:scaffold7351_cov259-Pinguiococcus_pyrenoidosus.AAC.17
MFVCPGMAFLSRRLCMSVQSAPQVRLKNFKRTVESCVTKALVTSFGAEMQAVDPLVTPATKAEFGDYQCNVCLSLAKKMGAKPRDLAGQLTPTLNAELAQSGLFQDCEIAGPGFLNIKFRDEALAEVLKSALDDVERMGIAKVRGMANPRFWTPLLGFFPGA